MNIPWVSPYVKCPSCKKVIHDPKLTLIALAQECPQCGAAGKCRACWPSLLASRWVETVSQFPLNRADDYNILAFLLCAWAEAMLADLLEDILIDQGAQREHVEVILDSHEGRNKRLDLLTRLCSRSAKDVLVSNDMTRFFDAWVRLVPSRNRFGHGLPAGEEFKHFPDRDDIEEVRANMLRAFATLHNSFVGKGSVRTSA